MMSLIKDFRSGEKLELIIPVFNEQVRIPNILNHYKDVFDIVLLDGGSVDLTISLALEHGITVYKRDPGPIYTEQYFAHYANIETKSGFSFYMFADEYVEKDELLILYEKLKLNDLVVVGDRIDWCYGYKVNWFKSSLPRGFRKGTVKFDSLSLHQGLKFEHGMNSVHIDIQHLQVWDMRKFLGQCGGYAFIEIERFYSQDHSFWRFFKRFFLFELLGLPRRLWLQRKTPWAFQLWQCFIAITVPAVGVLCLIEQRYLMGPAEQLRLYKSFYEKK